MPIPLADWADRRLSHLAGTLDAAAIATLSGDALLRMRARLNGFRVPGLVSAGGGCRFHRTRDGWIALNLARPDDIDLLPALFGTTAADAADPAQLADLMARAGSQALVAQGRLLGMALAALDEPPPGPATAITARGQHRRRASGAVPLVVDFSALWSGPLAARLLGLAGARVIRVESVTRPDRMREGDPALFDWLGAGKEHWPIDFQSASDRARLTQLIHAADVLIEAARPRALRQLGFDADALVRAVPGLAWITITGHGIAGEAGNWVGFGDDAAVAGGLSAALRDATGKIGFVGDAIADPLSGLLAAGAAADLLVRGEAARVIVSMSGTVAQALGEVRRSDPQGLGAQLAAWAKAEGAPLAPD